MNKESVNHPRSEEPRQCRTCSATSFSRIHRLRLSFIRQMDNLTANDMIRANKVLQNSGTITAVPETNLEYAMIIAASATGTPVEFFKGLKPRDAIKIKTKVTNFFFGEE